MVRERIKELVDFARNESPYRSATKGWINDDVFLSWGRSADQASNQGDELANVSLLWKPINELLTIIFVVVLLASIFVFSAVSFAQGKFHFAATQVLITSENDLVRIENDPIQPEVNSFESIEMADSLDSQLEVIELEDTAAVDQKDQNLTKGMTTADMFQSKHL